ncbi:amidohydrolase family protein [Natronococcus wangiae]|uniref:amidohydrolase family protein n=1 Tax=Natronococcus wangiae TaxID=3068275 RepID=UPI00273E1795|nr:amidohydrolase family protein [Natronococcus sp. AD5]
MNNSSSSSGDSPSCSSESSGSNAVGVTRSEPTATRRRHLAITAGVGLIATTGGCLFIDSDESIAESGTPGQTARIPDDSETVDDLPLFDAHTHVVPTKARGRDPLSADELVDRMDDHGVDRAVVLAFDSPESYPVQAPSWWVLEETDAYPDRLVPFCTIDPRTLIYGTDTADELLERYVERGARGFGELKVGMAVDDERLETLYERCADYELPILFHTDRQMMTDEVGLPRLENVLASYPEVDFVAHAHGWWAHISADVEPEDRGRLPEGSIESPGRVSELLAEYDNIYGDVSTLAGWNALTRDEAYGQAFLESHHDQLVFGSDYLFPGQDVPQFDLFERFELELDAWANVRYRNLEGLLR